MRERVEHALAKRSVSDSVVVKVELIDGTVGYGETLPREYVTGETVSSVIDHIRGSLGAAVLSFRADSYSEALDQIEALPWEDDDGRVLPAARAAVELALLDVSMRRFRRGLGEAVGWLGLARMGLPGSASRVRFSGVLASRDPGRVSREVRRMYWGGLRDFKVKVGDDGDDERLRVVMKQLRRPIEARKVTVRVDVNGAWDKDRAIERLSDWQRLPISAIEQPLASGDEADLPVIHDLTDVPLVFDESLVREEDARRLIGLGVADGFNIRISKCGGLLPALKLAALAARHGVIIQLGCMVGETSILSAAAVRFIQICPGIRWAEGCFGRFLLAEDVVRRSIRFGYGGRVPRLTGIGWGIEVADIRLASLAAADPIAMVFD